MMTLKWWIFVVWLLHAASSCDETIIEHTSDNVPDDFMYWQSPGLEMGDLLNCVTGLEECLSACLNQTCKGFSINDEDAFCCTYGQIGDVSRIGTSMDLIVTFMKVNISQDGNDGEVEDMAMGQELVDMLMPGKGMKYVEGHCDGASPTEGSTDMATYDLTSPISDHSKDSTSDPILSTLLHSSSDSPVFEGSSTLFPSTAYDGVSVDSDTASPSVNANDARSTSPPSTTLYSDFVEENTSGQTQSKELPFPTASVSSKAPSTSHSPTMDGSLETTTGINTPSVNANDARSTSAPSSTLYSDFFEENTSGPAHTTELVFSSTHTSPEARSTSRSSTMNVSLESTIDNSTFSAVSTTDVTLSTTEHEYPVEPTSGISTPSAIDNGILSTTAPWTTLSSDIVQESTSGHTQSAHLSSSTDYMSTGGPSTHVSAMASESPSTGEPDWTTPIVSPNIDTSSSLETTSRQGVTTTSASLTEPSAPSSSISVETSTTNDGDTPTPTDPTDGSSSSKDTTSSEPASSTTHPLTTVTTTEPSTEPKPTQKPIAAAIVKSVNGKPTGVKTGPSLRAMNSVPADWKDATIVSVHVKSGCTLYLFPTSGDMISVPNQGVDWLNTEVKNFNGLIDGAAKC